MDRRLVKTSKFLSYILRHHPQSIGLQLDPRGWAAVDELVVAARRHGRNLNEELIREVVANNDKKRFALSADGCKIRANQGHSVKVDLELRPTPPPRLLYHGTAAKFMASISKQGLLPSGRHHVHLSADLETALKVGRRHGVPVVLRIDAVRMSADGHPFYRSANGVWLADKVEPKYISTANFHVSGCSI